MLPEGANHTSDREKVDTGVRTRTGGTNTEAVTGVMETVTEVTEPRVDQEWEERTAVGRDEQRPRDIATKRKVVTGGRHRTERITRRTNKEKDASAKKVRGRRLDEEADAAPGSEPHV